MIYLAKIDGVATPHLLLKIFKKLCRGGSTDFSSDQKPFNRVKQGSEHNLDILLLPDEVHYVQLALNTITPFLKAFSTISAWKAWLDS